MTTLHAEWARREFSHAALGDKRRSDRAVDMAGTMARSPGGHLSGVFSTEAEREAAYRFVRNRDIEAAALGRAALETTARRCFGKEHVFVPVDASSLNLRDPNGTRGMGTIGTHGKGAQGLHVMSAIAVDTDGVSLGMCGQRYWVRRSAVGLTSDDYDPRPVEEKETRHWLDVIGSAVAAFASHAPATAPFFQLDRGGDAWHVLAYAADHDVLLTTRAAHNRRVGKTYLWSVVAAVEPQCSYVIHVPEGPNRTARWAAVQVQFCVVTLDVKDRRSGQHRDVPMWAVRVVEVGTTPSGEQGIEWMLLTTFPVHTIADAIFVVRGYTARWRIEEFHKTLKSGACRLEDSMLHRRENIERYAVISSSVAIHLQRVLQLSRSSPDEPATIVLTRHEIDATILMRKPKGVSPGDTPALSDVVRWIADIGGFMGPAQRTIRAASTNDQAIRRPGLRVLRRGFERIETVAMMLADGVVKL